MFKSYRHKEDTNHEKKHVEVSFRLLTVVNIGQTTNGTYEVSNVSFSNDYIKMAAYTIDANTTLTGGQTAHLQQAIDDISRASFQFKF